ncbi:hypothetical protein [Aliikangiella maris]|uniref:Uncharacterized protein n=2 Tax=Aliikangiella maris TaxID=3162458 RepID=A0ABV2BYY4_9GAMM
MGMNQSQHARLNKFEFAEYSFCGGIDDGYTIFMFVHPEDENQGFTLSLRDHEGFDDHDDVNFEGDSAVPEYLKKGILEKLRITMEEQKDDEEVFNIINRCVLGVSP